MSRFTNKLSGSVVNVDDATASQLGPDWVSADAVKSEPKPRTKRN